MAISAPLRLSSVKFNHGLSRPNLSPAKTLISLSPLIPSKHSSLRTISIERVPPKPRSSLRSASVVPLRTIEDLPPKLQDIVKLFQSVKNPKSKYEQLIFYGKRLPPLDTQFKTLENKVQGCVSQVWVRAVHENGRNVRFEADSDSILTKGLAALLVQGLSGLPVEDILRVTPDFVRLLELQQSLSPSRNNGFLNMLKMMQRKALQLCVEAENKGGGSVVESPSMSSSIGVDYSEGDLNMREISEMGTRESGLGIRGLRIKEKLGRELGVSELVVEDVSDHHAGHAGVRGSSGETHFNLKVVSKDFEGKSLVKRHRMIYDLLQEELNSGLHALSIEAKTPSEVSDG